MSVRKWFPEYPRALMAGEGEYTPLTQIPPLGQGCRGLSLGIVTDPLVEVWQCLLSVCPRIVVGSLVLSFVDITAQSVEH